MQLSLTKAELQTECGKKYEYKYVRRIPAPSTPALAFGAAIHYMFEQFFKKNYRSPKSFAGQWSGFYWPSYLALEKDNDGNYHGLTQTEKGWLTPPTSRERQGVIFYSPDKVVQLERRGIGILHKFYGRHVAIRNSGVVLGVEERFEIPMGDFIVVGKIDRRDKGRNGKKVRLVDYKTGARNGDPFIEKKLRKGLQLSIYTIAEMMRNPEITSPDQVEVSFYLADEPSDAAYMNASRTESDLVKAVEKLTSIKEKIESGTFHRRVTRGCKRFCEFFDTCMEERNSIVSYEEIPVARNISIVIPPKPKREKQPSQAGFGFMKSRKAPEKLLEEMLAARQS